MAKSETFPTKQPDPFGTILGNTFRLIRESWQALMVNLNTILLVYILPSVLGLAFLYALLPEILSFTPGQRVDNINDIQLNDDMNVPLVLGILIGGGILLILLSIAAIVVQLASARGQKIPFSEVIDQSWRFFLRFIGLGLLIGLAVIVGAILFIIPGIIAAFLLSFATYFMVDKNTGVVAAMKGSAKLVRKNWKIVIAYVLVLIAISAPQIVPYLGAIASAILSIAYFCLPAILYLRMANTTK